MISTYQCFSNTIFIEKLTIKIVSIITNFFMIIHLVNQSSISTALPNSTVSLSHFKLPGMMLFVQNIFKK